MTETKDVISENDVYGYYIKGHCTARIGAVCEFSEIPMSGGIECAVAFASGVDQGRGERSILKKKEVLRSVAVLMGEEE